jgi:hypothetical protein
MGTTTNLKIKNMGKEMLPLTPNQKEFLLETFFKTPYYAGWRNIANCLLDTGQAIVAGMSPVWIGGIGNFIKTETAEGVFGRLHYKFDLDFFLSSLYYQEVVSHHILVLNCEKNKLTLKIEELSILSERGSSTT